MTTWNIAAKGSFANRTIIVAGGAGKLGRAIVPALAAAGANVIINDIEAAEPAVKALEADLKSQGNNVRSICRPIQHSAEEIVQEVIAEFGRLDAICCPVLAPIPWSPFENADLKGFTESFEHNVLGPIALAKAAWPHFQKQKYGRVVNFTSDSLLGFPTASTYTMAKGALFGINKTLAAEGAPHNIKVNCVSPVAYAPNMERHIARFAPHVQQAFKEKYIAEANLPTILALLSEGCDVSGEVFNSAAWAVGRSLWGVVKGEAGVKTMEDCLSTMGEVSTRNRREVYEPGSMVDFSDFHVGYALGEEVQS
jgi:NAD(P)-dependent dehydrogenase (short-subunit alcohol dehydrogenase family)